MSETISPLAGKPAPESILVDVPKLLAAYTDDQPDPSVPAQRIAFGTSGHRGSSLERSFNAWHVLGISQAICDYRKSNDIDGRCSSASTPMRCRYRLSRVHWKSWPPTG